MTYTIKKGTSTVAQTPWYTKWFFSNYITSRLSPSLVYTTIQTANPGDNSKLYETSNVYTGVAFQSGTPWSFTYLTLRWLPNYNKNTLTELFAGIKYPSGTTQMVYLGQLDTNLRPTFEMDFRLVSGTTFQLLVTSDENEIGMAQFPKQTYIGPLTMGVLPQFNDLNGKAPRDMVFPLLS